MEAKTCTRQAPHVCTVNGPCNGFPRQETKPFAKTDKKIQAVTIDEHGNLTFLATDANDIFLELGETKTQRASHVEPNAVALRVVFHLLRLFGDKNAVAEWTRHWRCLWRVNTAPVGGPVLKWKHVWQHDTSQWIKGLSQYDRVALWRVRQSAIDAEIKFLNNWFLVR